MSGASIGSVVLVPTKRLSQTRPPFDLKIVVPSEFLDWRIDPHVSGVVNPQTQALLNQTYSQVLSRTYVNSREERIMLSIAYSSDQSDVSTQVHFPEVCYPAQGFQIHRIVNSSITLGTLHIPVKRLETSLGNTRFEPVTYWIMLGKHLTSNGWDRRLAEIRHGLKGEIADGMLVRISSISTDATRAFKLQDQFADALKTAMRPTDQPLLFGAGEDV